MILAALGLAAAGGMAHYARLALSARRQRQANVALQELRGQFSNLLETLEEAVFLHHADGRTELLNAPAKEILDTEADVLHELAPGWEVLDGDGAPMDSSKTPLGRAVATGSACSDVLGLRCPEGSLRWLAVRARPFVRPGEERPRAVVASCTDVTQQREMELDLTDLAQRDPLTGLWNQRRFEDDLAKQLARCRRYGERATLLALDLNGFQRVNETFGQLIGDDVLYALGDGLSRRLRASDSAARIGGDKFAVVLMNVDREEARNTAQEVAARLTEFAREKLDARLSLTLSVGVVVLDAEAGGVQEVLAAAYHEMSADKPRPDLAALHEMSADKPRPDLAALGAAEVENGGTHSREARISSLRALLTAVQARDSYTAVHSRQVVMLARAVARRLGLDDGHVREVESAALLHDLGKIAVPDAILGKRGPLTEHEQLLMRQHPVVGAQMVSSIPDLEHLGPAIRAEHERWDGTGYPDGLAGEAIPLGSRIAFVCDAYQAMTSNRPYRRALSHDMAIAEIESESGRQFCPAAAAALLEALRAERAEGHDSTKAGAA